MSSAAAITEVAEQAAKQAPLVIDQMQISRKFALNSEFIVCYRCTAHDACVASYSSVQRQQQQQCSADIIVDA
jgi:hypothetical protein